VSAPVGVVGVWNLVGGGAGVGGLARCWALRDQPVGWLARGLLSLPVADVRSVVVGGFVV
jgi:hypothetical protein